MNARPLRMVVGCGYLGERVARRWLEAGSRVVGITRRAAHHIVFLGLGLEHERTHRIDHHLEKRDVICPL